MIPVLPARIAAGSPGMDRPRGCGKRGTRRKEYEELMSQSSDMEERDETIRHNVELAYASFAIIAEDGKIDMGELNFLLGMALKDGKVTDDERRILNNVFNRIQEEDVDPMVWERIQAVRLQHSI
jgi:hypothetical protein